MIFKKKKQGFILITENIPKKNKNLRQKNIATQGHKLVKLEETTIQSLSKQFKLKTLGMLKIKLKFLVVRNGWSHFPLPCLCYKTRSR